MLSDHGKPQSPWSLDGYCKVMYLDYGATIGSCLVCSSPDSHAARQPQLGWIVVVRSTFGLLAPENEA
jgi:hypothetical protein